MDPEFLRWLASLPPEQQMQVIAQLQQQTQPTSFDRGGNPEPLDLGDQAKLLNYRQDQTYSLADKMQTAQGGPGSYGLGAFDPVAVPGSAPQLMGQQTLLRAAEAPEWSMEGFIGRLMNDNYTGSQALSQYQQGLISDTEVGDSLREFGPKQVSTIQVDGSYAMEYDTSEASRFATDLQNSLFTDPDDTGPEFEQSPQAQFFSEQGLPTPMEQYGQGRYALDQLLGPETAMMASEYDQAVDARRGAQEPMEAARAAQARFLLQEESPEMFANTRRGGGSIEEGSVPGGGFGYSLVPTALGGEGFTSPIGDPTNFAQWAQARLPGGTTKTEGRLSPELQAGNVDPVTVTGPTRASLESEATKTREVHEGLLDSEAEARYMMWADPRRRAIEQANAFAINSGRSPLDDAISNRQMQMFMQTGQGPIPQQAQQPPPLSVPPASRQENNQNWRDKFKLTGPGWGGYQG